MWNGQSIAEMLHLCITQLYKFIYKKTTLKKNTLDLF